MKTMIFSVEGMKCGGCKSKITDALNARDEVSELEISLDDKEVKVSGDAVSGMSLKQAIEDLGFQVVGMKKA